MLSRAFLQIARCPESQLRKIGNEMKLQTPPFLVKYTDPHYKKELNRDILKYMNHIKALTIEYFDKFAISKAKVNRLYEVT